MKGEKKEVIPAGWWRSFPLVGAIGAIYVKYI
jgi:hypothetical protein